MNINPEIEDYFKPGELYRLNSGFSDLIYFIPNAYFQNFSNSNPSFSNPWDKPCFGAGEHFLFVEFFEWKAVWYAKFLSPNNTTVCRIADFYLLNFFGKI